MSSLGSSLSNDSRNQLNKPGLKPEPQYSSTNHSPQATACSGVKRAQLPVQWTHCIEQLTDWFADFDFHALGIKTGFIRRTPRKVTALLFLKAAILMVSQNSVSLSRWAALLGVLGHGSLAKQSLWERVNQSAVDFIQHVLSMVLSVKSTHKDLITPEVFKQFKRVLVQDSTTIKLTPKLASSFPGSSNKLGSKNGILKIQAIHDLLSQRFVYFALSGFTRNDQASAQDVLKVLRAGDLVIRDLGYFVVESFLRIVRSKAFFLTRIRMDLGTWNPCTGKKLDLLKELNRSGNLDRDIWMGNQKMPARLVAIKLPAALAAERRRKAKNNRDKRCKPDARSLKLFGWAIFITNVPNNVCTTKDIARIYGLRWRIETIFKAWKSHFRICDIPKGSAEQLRVFICARLIFITVLANLSGSNWYDSRQQQEAHPYSMLRMAALLGDFFIALCFEAWNIRVSDALSIQLAYHCLYDKRSRRNYVQNFLELS